MATKLTLLKGSIPPPKRLGKQGSALWRAVMPEYKIEDSGGLAMLLLACEAYDRAEACRQQIERDGVVIRTKGGVKDHPSLKHELANRSFVVRTLQRLGLDVEPVRQLGRPEKPTTWRGDDGEAA